MAVHDVGTQVLGTNVRWVGFTKHLAEPKRSVPDPLLDPELADSQVADPSDAAPSAYADRRRAVDQEREGLLDPKIAGSEPFAGPVHRSAELGLGGGKRKYFLGAAVVPNRVGPAKAHTPALVLRRVRGQPAKSASQER